jgi:ribulose-phosphate 3-epimerase
VNIHVGVDGGMDVTTAPQVVRSGATVLVAGSSIYNDEDSVAHNISVLRRAGRRGMSQVA